MIKPIKYRKLAEDEPNGYKFMLEERHRWRLEGDFPNAVLPMWADNLCGTLSIASGYAWDGPSGPVTCTPEWMWPSLVHDVLYQMMRDGRLPFQYRKLADKEMLYALELTGMGWFRRTSAYWAVRIFAGRYARPTGA